VGFLSDAQKAAIRAAVTTPSVEGEALADVYRNPAAADGKTGARVLTTVGIPIRIRPAGQDDSNLKLIPLANPVNAARVAHVGKVAVGVDIRNGDELRIGMAKYLVEGVGIFTNARLAALSEIKGRVSS
jgi:hypothetical protein